MHHALAERKPTPAPVRMSSAGGGERLNILYVSVTRRTERPWLDPSVRYRCFCPAEAARALGHRAFVATLPALATLDPALFDCVVIHRPAFTPELRRFVATARAAGVRLLADYDDLIFDPAHATDSPQFQNDWNTRSALACFAANTDALRLFDEFTVSTQPLHDRLLALHPAARVRVLPNAVSPALWSQLAPRGYEAAAARPWLGYFSGTATHDRDFRVAAPGIAAFCRARGVALRLVGPLAVDASAFAGMVVERLPILPLDRMFDALAGCRVVVAPLAVSPFNAAKSHIKLLEAALACTACAASAIPDMARHDGTGKLLTLVEPGGDWAAALERAWDGFDLPAAALARAQLLRRLDAVTVFGPLFQEAARW